MLLLFPPVLTREIVYLEKERCTVQSENKTSHGRKRIAFYTVTEYVDWGLIRSSIDIRHFFKWWKLNVYVIELNWIANLNKFRLLIFKYYAIKTFVLGCIIHSFYERLSCDNKINDYKETWFVFQNSMLWPISFVSCFKQNNVLHMYIDITWRATTGFHPSDYNVCGWW